MKTFLYIVGLILVLLYIILGVDDFIWDILTLFRKRNYKKHHVPIKELETIPPKMMAVMIGAWHESNVIKNVVENLIASTNYPISMYHVFVGVYPNDSATINQVEMLEKEFTNVHMVINDTNGPTSKAQNLNYVIKFIKKFEKKNNISFASFTVHDSEDVVHPYELLMTNYMIDKHDAIQFPVFPIINMPKFRNFFKNITTCTYADEFAENHFSTLVGRYITGAFVPCAGTGFALSKRTVDSFNGEDIFPSNSLTEDYQLSLSLYERGIQLYYILEKVPRVTNGLGIKWDYITTRSLFPNTYKAAVKQKTRWIYGITMQSAKFRKILTTKNMPMLGRYTLYKDLKAKYGNLVVFYGYLVMVYWIFSFFINLPPIYVKGTLPYYLCFIVTGMMIIRQIYRGIAIKNVYGLRSVFFAVLFPPLFPLRLIYGNIINLVATVKAYEQKITLHKENHIKKEKDKDKYKKEGSYKKPKIIKWSHTDHEFLDYEILKRYHRNIGDTLLMKEYVTSTELLDALTGSLETHERIGTYLLRNNTIDENELMDSLAITQHREYLDEKAVKKIANPKLIKKKDLKYLEQVLALPLFEKEDMMIFGVCNESPDDVKDKLSIRFDKNVYIVYLTKSTVINGLNKKYNKTNKFDKTIALYKEGKISSEQFIIIMKYSVLMNKRENSIIKYIGINHEL